MHIILALAIEPIVEALRLRRKRLARARPCCKHGNVQKITKLLFPLYGRWWFGTNIVNDTVNPFDLIYNFI